MVIVRTPFVLGDSISAKTLTRAKTLTGSATRDAGPPRHPPPLPLRRFHLDSDTYRAVLRIISHCAELEIRVDSSPRRLSPSRPGPSEQERPASSEGAAALGGLRGKDGCGVGEVTRDGDGREGHDKGAGRGSPQGLGEVLPDGLLNGCPGVADADVGNSPLVEGLGGCEVREEDFDDSRNVVSREERPCAGSSDFLDDLLVVDFSSLLEELGLRDGEEEGKDGPVSDGLENKQPLEAAGSLGFSETCPPAVAPEHGEKRQGRTNNDVSLGNVSPVGDELPAELVCNEREPLSVPPESPHPVGESWMETQLKVCDSSTRSTDGSAIGELDGHHEDIPMCAVEGNEMEEGEIPNEGEVLDVSFDLEFQDTGKEEMTLEESHLADDSAEKLNASRMVGAFTARGPSSSADLIKEELRSIVHESEQIIGSVELKPQTKKKSAKGTKKTEKKVKKKVDLSKKQPNDKKGPEHQKKAKGVVSTKALISENIVSSCSSLAEVSLKDIAIQSEENPSNTEDVKVQQKRKRAPLTENRKEKKKLAKKRKRAETNRKLGVKRLKLEMMSKPKKVVPCSFYQKGRCQKGDSCKFSHDIIPDTKSTPCTFFARGICLKGDDCPFDHQLSKYPCHSYMSQGRCNRGDNCLFSHKIPSGEPSSAASMSSQTDSTMLSGKQSLQKCLSSSNLLPSVVNTSMETTNTTTKTSMPKDSVEQMEKQPVKMPKGICFLSFGKETTNGINKQHHDLDLKKCGGIRIQKQEEKITLCKLQKSNENLLTSPDKSLSTRTLMSLVKKDKSLSLLRNPPLLVQQNVEIKSCESAKSLASNTAASNGSKDFSNEESRVTDASRILEEFLCSGID